MSLASITLSGSIIKDAEQRFTPNNNQVINFNILTSRYDSKSKEEKTYPVKVTLWGESFNDILGRLKQGTAVLVSGRLQLEQFNDKNGKPVRLVAIEANRVHFANELSDARNQSMTGLAASAEQDSFRDQEVPF
jgi:single-strand DNA-binding protein